MRRGASGPISAVWADERRREMWRMGFDVFGRAAVVRTKFDELYKSTSLDGVRASAANALTPIEIDYAFFKDRSAHTSPSLEPVQRAVSDTARRATECRALEGAPGHRAECSSRRPACGSAGSRRCVLHRRRGQCAGTRGTRCVGGAWPLARPRCGPERCAQLWKLHAWTGNQHGITQPGSLTDAERAA